MLSLINSSVFDEKEAHRAHWVFSWEITTHAFSLTHSSFFASRRFSFFFFLVLVSRFNWEIIITTTADRSHRWLRPTTRRAIDDAVIIASTSYFNKLYQRYTTKNIYSFLFELFSIVSSIDRSSARSSSAYVTLRFSYLLKFQRLFSFIFSRRLLKIFVSLLQCILICTSKINLVLTRSGTACLE